MTSIDQAINELTAVRPFHTDTLASAGTSMCSAIEGLDRTDQDAQKAVMLISIWATKSNDALHETTRKFEEFIRTLDHAIARQKAGVDQLADAVAIRDAVASDRNDCDEMISYFQKKEEVEKLLLSKVRAKNGSMAWSSLVDTLSRLQDEPDSPIKEIQSMREKISSAEFSLTSNMVIPLLPGHKEAAERQAELRAIEEKLYRDPPSGGCYVATAVYGSYDCPQVWTLRRYRDYGLASSLLGRLFIRFYYATSPTIVKWFGEYRWFNAFWRSKLDRMVSRLEEAGYDNTPYADRDWRLH